MGYALFSFTPQPLQPSSWEATLGLESLVGMERLERVQRGLPVQAFQRFSEASGVSREALANAIHISLRTIQRRSETDARLAPGPSERLVRLADLYAHAAAVLGDDALAAQWMQTPRAVFGGRKPFDLAGSELGAHEVEDLLLRIEQGVFY